MNRKEWIKEVTLLERELLKIFPRVVGIDEVSVCSYIGPIIVCGVVIDPSSLTKKLPEVTDSKKISYLIDSLAPELMSVFEFGVEYVTPRECDKDYLYFEYLAIKRLIKRLSPEFVLIDYHSVPGLHIPQWGVRDGDSVLYSVAAASIIAKYYHNRWCEKFHQKFPEYNVINNKCSFSLQLFNLTIKYGLTKDHRYSWIKSTCIKKGINYDQIPRRT